MGQSHNSSDRRIDPPVERSFHSGNARFHLRIFTIDGWKTREPLAELRRGDHVLWTNRLPNSHGPRDAVVLDSGQVVLLDEWINVASLRAITLLDPKGEVRAVFSYGQVRDAVGVSSTDLSRLARTGPYGRGTWLGGHPVVVGHRIEIPAGGKTLILDLSQKVLQLRSK